MDPKLADYMIRRIEKIDEKVDRLLAFKWQVMGGALVVSVLITIAVQVAQLFVNNK